jgi:hypothetical protein
MKSFLKRLGNGMLESLAFVFLLRAHISIANFKRYTGGAGIDYVPTGMPTRAGMDRRSNDQVLGDVYGVQLMIW